MNADLEQYKKLLVEDANLFMGQVQNLVAFDEYIEFNKVGQAIEEILEVKYGEKEINKVRMSTI